MKWYYEKGAGQEGPTDTAGVIGLLESGVMNSTNKVWRSGFSEWLDAADIPEFRAVIDQNSAAASEMGLSMTPETTIEDDNSFDDESDSLDESSPSIFADGDEEADESLETATLIQAPAEMEDEGPPQPPMLELGSAVWAEWGAAWYRGSIDELDDDQYHVAFDDGDDAWYPASEIASAEQPHRSLLVAGAKVLAIWSGDGRYYPGTISSMSDDTSVAIEFEDDTNDQADLNQILLIADQTR